MSALDQSTTLPRVPWWLIALGFVAIAVFFMWEEHQAHILGALPYLIFAACPLMHLVMHRGHHGHGHHGSGDRDDAR